MIHTALLMDNNVGDDNEVIVVVMVTLVGLVFLFWLCGVIARLIRRRLQNLH